MILEPTDTKFFKLKPKKMLPIILIQMFVANHPYTSLILNVLVDITLCNASDQITNATNNMVFQMALRSGKGNLNSEG